MILKQVYIKFHRSWVWSRLDIHNIWQIVYHKLYFKDISHNICHSRAVFVWDKIHNLGFHKSNEFRKDNLHIFY